MHAVKQSTCRRAAPCVGCGFRRRTFVNLAVGLCEATHQARVRLAAELVRACTSSPERALARSRGRSETNTFPTSRARLGQGRSKIVERESGREARVGEGRCAEKGKGVVGQTGLESKGLLTTESLELRTAPCIHVSMGAHTQKIENKHKFTNQPPGDNSLFQSCREKKSVYKKNVTTCNVRGSHYAQTFSYHHHRCIRWSRSG